MERTHNLNTRAGGSPAASGPGATGRKTIAGKRAAWNKRLQHSLRFGKTVGGRRKAKLMQTGFHFHKAVRRYRKTVHGKNGVGSCDAELVVSVEGESIFRHNSAVRAERQTCRIGRLAVQHRFHRFGGRGMRDRLAAYLARRGNVLIEK